MEEQRRQRLVFGGVAAAVLIGIVAFAALGGGVDSAHRGERTPTPTATPADAPRDLFGGSLQPGVRYRTRAFEPALSLVVADAEWFVTRATDTTQLVLERRRRTDRPGSERPPKAFLSLSSLAALASPRRRPHAPPELALSDTRAWLDRHPDLVVGRAEPASVAGLAGTAFDVAVRYRHGADRRPPCRPLLFECTGVVPDRSFPDGARIRTIVLRTGARPLVIDLIGASARRLRALEGPAGRVLASLQLVTRP